MEESKFFRNIWRFNAVVIAIASVLAILALLFIIYFIYKEQTRSRYKNEIVNVNPETNIEETFRLGQARHIKGSQSLIIPLYSDQSFGLKYSGSKSTSSTRNLLFSNIHTELNHWLLPDNNWLIPQYKLINKSNSYRKEEDIVTIFYQIVKSDTNGDKRLTESDKLYILLSKPDGTKLTEILENVDHIIGYELLDQKLLAVLFSREGQGYTAYISLSDFKVSKITELPKAN